VETSWQKERAVTQFKDNRGNWYARITATDASGKRHQIKRRVKDKAEGKQLLKALIRSA